MPQSVNDTLAHRESVYGSFEDVSFISQGLKAILSASSGYGALREDQHEALDMICSKMARIVCGNANYADSWHDIAGYASLVERALSSHVIQHTDDAP